MRTNRQPCHVLSKITLVYCCCRYLSSEAMFSSSEVRAESSISEYTTSVWEISRLFIKVNSSLLLTSSVQIKIRLGSTQSTSTCVGVFLDFVGLVIEVGRATRGKLTCLFLPQLRGKYPHAVVTDPKPERLPKIMVPRTL